MNYPSDTSSNYYTYRLSFNDKNSLQEFKDKLSNEKNIEKMNVNFN